MKLALFGTRGTLARYGGFETFAEKLAVGPYRRGFNVPTRDPEQIAAVVLDLLNDPPRLQSLRGAARTRRAHYSFHAFQGRVADMLDILSKEQK